MSSAAVTVGTPAELAAELATQRARLDGLDGCPACNWQRPIREAIVAELTTLLNLTLADPPPLQVH